MIMGKYVYPSPPGPVGITSRQVTLSGTDTLIFGPSPRRWAIIFGVFGGSGFLQVSFGQAAANQVTSGFTFNASGTLLPVILSHEIFGSLLHEEFRMADNGISTVVSVAEISLLEGPCPYCHG
jgi:hypothetical protein